MLNITYFQDLGDITPPNMDIILPTNMTYNVSGLTFNVTANDTSNISFCWFNIGGANITMTQDTTNFTYENTSILDSGYKFTAYCNDTVGNNASSYVYFTVDTTEPVLSSISSNSAVPVDTTEPYYVGGDTSPVFSFTTNENATCYWSLANVTFTEDGTTGAQSHSFTAEYVDFGPDYLYIKCDDLFYNVFWDEWETYCSYIQGTVVGNSNNPVENAMIYVLLNNTDNSTYTMNTTTDGDGFFQHELYNGTWTICAYDPYNMLRGDCTPHVVVPYGEV